MNILIDTHALIWYVDQDHLLTPLSHAEITDPTNDICVSAASIWEIAIKHGLGKLALSQPFQSWVAKALSDLDATILPITVDYAAQYVTLPRHHGDPFDRMIVAQALVESMSIVSSDAQLDAYGVRRIW